MTNRVYNWLWWAYLFDMFDITLAGINILPEFVACLLLIGVLNDMKQEEANIANLYLFVYILLAADIGSIGLRFIGLQTVNMIPLSIITTIINLYLWYVLFTTAAQLCDRHAIAAGHQLYTLRNWSVALQVSLYLLVSYLLQNTVLLWVIVIAQLILIIWFRTITVEIEKQMHKTKQEIETPDICTDETNHLEIITTK